MVGVNVPGIPGACETRNFTYLVRGPLQTHIPDPSSVSDWGKLPGYVPGLDGHDHYDDVIMTMLASQITSLPVVCSIVYSDVNQRKHQSSASLAFVLEIHRGPVNFPHKWPVTRKMFPFDDVIMWRWYTKKIPQIWSQLFFKVIEFQTTTLTELSNSRWFTNWIIQRSNSIHVKISEEVLFGIDSK